MNKEKITKMNKKQTNILTMALMLCALLTFTSCHEPELPQPINIDGNWGLNSITDTRSAVIGEQTIDVYIHFESDAPINVTRGSKVEPGPLVTQGVFTLWQKLGEGAFRSFKGSWTLTDNMLTGKYSDGTHWGASYEITIDDGGTRMTMVAPTETLVYDRTALPAGLN